MKLVPVLLLLFCFTAEAQGTKPTKTKRTKTAKKVKRTAKKVKTKAKLKLGSSIVGVKISKAKVKARPVRPLHRRRRVPMPLQVIRPHRKFVPRNRIVFVLDVSGSMSGNRIKKAVDACLVFSSDELQVAVITFNSSTLRWAGVKDPCRHPKAAKCGKKCLPPAWARLPMHYPEVSNWIGSFKGGGGTQPVPALRAALSLRRPGFMIVFISDGEFSPNLCSRAVKKMRKWRRKKKLDWVPILVWGIGWRAKNQESLKRLAKVGGGGFYVHGKERRPW